MGQAHSTPHAQKVLARAAEGNKEAEREASQTLCNSKFTCEHVQGAVYAALVLGGLQSRCTAILSPRHMLRSSHSLLQIEQQQQTSGYFHTLKGRRAALVVAVGEHRQHGLASDSFQVIAVKVGLLANMISLFACANQLHI